MRYRKGVKPLPKKERKKLRPLLVDLTETLAAGVEDNKVFWSIIQEIRSRGYDVTPVIELQVDIRRNSEAPQEMITSITEKDKKFLQALKIST